MMLAYDEVRENTTLLLAPIEHGLWGTHQLSRAVSSTDPINLSDNLINSSHHRVFFCRDAQGGLHGNEVPGPNQEGSAVVAHHTWLRSDAE